MEVECARDLIEEFRGTPLEFEAYVVGKFLMDLSQCLGGAKVQLSDADLDNSGAFFVKLYLQRDGENVKSLLVRGYAKIYIEPEVHDVMEAEIEGAVTSGGDEYY